MDRRTLLTATLSGALAGTAGTAAMDLFWYARQALSADQGRGADAGHVAASRASSGQPVSSAIGDRSGDDEEPDDWSTLTAPALVGKRVYEGVTQRALEARFTRFVGAVVHWGYGMWWGGLFGLFAVSAPRSRPVWGPLFGAAVWGTSYLLLPVTGLYRPVWEYRPAELVPDLTAHLIYGAGTGATFTVIARHLG
jgi:hypothetical protein